MTILWEFDEKHPKQVQYPGAIHFTGNALDGGAFRPIKHCQSFAFFYYA
jgi:hypothetical protein